MIPCNNCLILPVCKSKKVIVCNLLHKWYSDSIYHHENTVEEWRQDWNRINKWFPNCIGIRIE